MATPVIQQYNRGSSWAGAASGQTPNISDALSQVASTAMSADANKYSADKQNDASKYGSYMQADASKFGATLQRAADEYKTDAAFATNLPNAALTGLANIGATGITSGAVVGKQGLAEQGGAIRNSQNTAYNQYQAEQDRKQQAKDRQSQRIGGVLGTGIAAAGALYAPGITKALGAAKGLFS